MYWCPRLPDLPCHGRWYRIGTGNLYVWCESSGKHGRANAGHDAKKTIILFELDVRCHWIVCFWEIRMSRGDGEALGRSRATIDTQAMMDHFQWAISLEVLWMRVSLQKMVSLWVLGFSDQSAWFQPPQKCVFYRRRVPWRLGGKYDRTSSNAAGIGIS